MPAMKTTWEPSTSCYEKMQSVLILLWPMLQAWEPTRPNPLMAEVALEVARYANVARRVARVSTLKRLQASIPK
jgi:hypothetical protein